jgi:hypothetical protein
LTYPFKVTSLRRMWRYRPISPDSPRSRPRGCTEPTRQFLSAADLGDTPSACRNSAHEQSDRNSSSDRIGFAVAANDLGWLDAVVLRDLIAAREVTPAEVAEGAIARIEAADPVLNAVVVPLPDIGRAIAAIPNCRTGRFTEAVSRRHRPVQPETQRMGGLLQQPSAAWWPRRPTPYDRLLQRTQAHSVTGHRQSHTIDRQQENS